MKALKSKLARAALADRTASKALTRFIQEHPAAMWFMLHGRVIKATWQARERK